MKRKFRKSEIFPILFRNYREYYYYHYKDLFKHLFKQNGIQTITIYHWYVLKKMSLWDII